MATPAWTRCSWCREILLADEARVEHIDAVRRRRLVLHRRLCAVEYVARTYCVSDAAAEALVARVVAGAQLATSTREAER